MATMKTLKFPGSSNVYEMVDATARAGVASLQTAVDGLVDDTLATSGKAADAAAVGAALEEQAAAIEESTFEANRTANLLAGSDHYEQLLTEVGAILFTDGTERNPTTFAAYRITPYIYLPAGSVIDITGLTNIAANAAVAVYAMDKTYSPSSSISGITSTRAINQTFVMPFDGYVRFGAFASTISGTVLRNVTMLTPLNVLVLGNSFTQGSFAYVPKIFEELGTKYRLNLVVGYIGNASISDHIDAISGNEAYTFVDEWNTSTTAWLRYAKGGSSEKTATQMLAMHRWDVIYIQPTGGISTESSVMTNAVTPAKALLRLLRAQLGYGFTYITGQWLTEQNSVPAMKTAMELLDSRVGFNWVLPIGTGIANARSNATLAALGTSGNMLYDDTHQQSGIPALISAYVVVESLLQMLGIAYTSIYKSTFFPTTENCIAINAYKSEGMTTPLPMTHGNSVGVTDANVLAAKQIASIAVRNPYVISDCSEILE